MKNILKDDLTFVMVLATLALIVTVYEILHNPKVSVKYDCRLLMGGWHPDVPVEVQKECRKLMSKNI